MMRTYCFYAVLLFCLLVESRNSKPNAVEEVSDVKDFKKILRTKNNVLALFYSSSKSASNIIKTFKEAAETVRGQGTMLMVDCSGEKDKKICKKLKVNAEPYAIRHYKDGEFHKAYDRKETATSIISFMRDPTGDLPWDEEDSLGDVVHIPDFQTLVKLLKKEVRPLMIMFYAPWCGFCKQLKPEYTAAANALKGKAVLAAIDVNRPENAVVRAKFNITGFPTLLYFEKGELKTMYDGDNKKDDLIKFINDPTSVKVKKPQEEEWSQTPSDVIHLTSETFTQFMEESASMLVMFYAPWCGHCKKMKPEYEKAAKIMKDNNSDGFLVAVDATKEKDLGKQYNVKGYPTIKYFKNGQFLWDVPTLRDAEKIVNFMKNPQEPPPPPPPQPDWEEEKSEVVHLNVENFKPTLRKKRHALVMFYAPWCGHCKNAKPEFAAAAEEMKDNIRVAFAALDCTKHQAVCSTMEVRGYPTFKYFNYYDKDKQDYSGGRMKKDFMDFMMKKESGQAIPTESNRVENYWDGIPGGDKIVEITDTNYKEKIGSSKAHFVLIHDGTGTKAEIKDTFASLARDYAHLATFASCNARSNKLFVKENKINVFPSLKFFKNGKAKDYPGSFAKSDMLNFLKKASPKEEL